MMPFFAVPQENVNYLRGAEAYVHGIRGQEAVWVSSAEFGTLRSGDRDTALKSSVVSIADSAVTIADEGSVCVSFPGREWSAEAKKRLEKLVSKAALKTIAPEERRELRELQGLRRENMPGRTYEDIMRTAELDRRLENLKRALEEYVNYLPC